MIKWFPITFQNIDNEQRYIIDWLFDYILLFLIFVLIFVGGILISLAKNKFLELKTFEASLLEFIWTLLPGFILIFIGIPSLSILYNRENIINPNLTIKISGHQWYWSYDYRDFINVEFDSYLKPIEELIKGEPRLLETDNHIILPLFSSRRLLISSSDVLHRWALPRLGLKADANPGRINILYLNNIENNGLFYGQCSEICGANHSFIPICIEVCSYYNFNLWIKTF